MPLYAIVMMYMVRTLWVIEGHRTKDIVGSDEMYLIIQIACGVSCVACMERLMFYVKLARQEMLANAMHERKHGVARIANC
jgi:hypothetical protein